MYGFIISIIHEKTKHIKHAVAFIELYNGKDPSIHFEIDGDIPKWLEAKPYWVFNYLYEWPGELTIKGNFPFICFKKDYERIELWVDSKTGFAEWAVTDYLYRELWYKIESDIDHVRVWVFPNFHTPRFLNIRTKDLGELNDLYIDGTQLKQIWKTHVEEKSSSHPFEWIKRLIGNGVVSDVIAKKLAELWWDYWRYPLGADNKNYKYKPESLDKKAYPVVGKQP